MKTHIIKTPTAELMIVELPEGAKNILPTLEGEGIIFTEEKQNLLTIKGVGLTGYTLLGKPDEISEEDARELVEKRTDIEGNCYFEDRGIVNGTTANATESLLSAIETQVYWENPHGIWSGTGGRPTMIIDGAQFNSAIECYNYQKKWDKAESRTFDRTRTLIFMKS